MRFLADECCDAGTVEYLRAADHDILYAKESLRGFDDDRILEIAESQGRILLTEDKDFGELVYRLRRTTYGIVLLRFEVSERRSKAQRLRDLINAMSSELVGKFVVLDARKVRIRSL